MSRKTKATHEETMAKRKAEYLRRKANGIIPKSELELQESDRSLARKLGLVLPKASPPDPDAIVFSRQGMLLPAFSRRGLTVRR